MKCFTWLLQKLFLPFVLGIVSCVSLVAISKIFSAQYFFGLANDNLLFFSLPKNTLSRPISDILPFAFIFIALYHLYKFTKDHNTHKEIVLQFTAGIITYLLLASLINPLTSLFLCVLFPFAFIIIKNKRDNYNTDPISLLFAPFQIFSWLPGCLFGLGLSQGFLIALLYFAIFLGIPFVILACLLRLLGD